MNKEEKKRKKKLQGKSNDYIVVTRDEILKFFPGSIRYNYNKHHKDMIDSGAVFKSKLGLSRTGTAWSHPQLIRKYIRLKALENKGWI